MISKAYLSLLQFLFLALTSDAISESFPHDSTDLPDDQKELKELESPRRDSPGFRSYSPYQGNVFSYRGAAEELPDFSYSLGKAGSTWDMNSDGSVAPLSHHAFPENGDVSKRGGDRRFKQGSQKFRFDPALNRLGLGKRDNSDRPKYNPGWKFIGLGKRIMPFLQSLNPTAFNADQMDRENFGTGTADPLIPYYRILAMHDISMFLDDMNERLGGNPRRSNRSRSPAPDHFHLSLYSPTGIPETLPKVKQSTSGFLAGEPQGTNPERSDKPQLFFTRSRKPTAMWRNKSKPLYDPGYLMTGLGK